MSWISKFPFSFFFPVSSEKVTRARSSGRPCCIEEVGQKAWEAAGETNPQSWFACCLIIAHWLMMDSSRCFLRSILQRFSSYVLQKSGQGCGLNITGVKVWLHTCVQCIVEFSLCNVFLILGESYWIFLALMSAGGDFIVIIVITLCSCDELDVICGWVWFIFFNRRSSITLVWSIQSLPWSLSSFVPCMSSCTVFCCSLRSWPEEGGCDLQSI